MLDYKCVSCGKKIEMDLKTVKKIICPYCGYRIIEKLRGKTVKTVSSGVPA